MVLLFLVLLASTTALAGATSTVSGSAYIDYWYLSSDRARALSLNPITPEAAIKIEVDVHEKVSFSARMCFGCHGLEIDRAHIDFTPGQYFNLQVGRVGVPFGEFSVRYDPTSHRTVSKPLIYEMGRMPYYGRNAFNLGVVPQPYVDTGAVVYGQLWFGEQVQLWYGAYAVAGYKGSNDVDWVSMRTPYYLDNNRFPSGGGRAVLTISGSPGSVFRDLTLGFSGMHGTYDPESQKKYSVFGADFSLRLGPVTFRTEAAWMRMNLDPFAKGYRYDLVDPWFEKGGFFAELEHPIGSHLIMLYRFDLLRRVGTPLPGALAEMSFDSRILRYTGAAQVLLGESVFLKASYEYWWFTDFEPTHAAHLGLGGMF
ncbi:MAG: hypothetical protein IPJ65_38760 [Archangiaceae bacterium]|nr:hypothetical protein [Archangiaceae bacterium]